MNPYGKLKRALVILSLVFFAVTSEIIAGDSPALQKVFSGDFYIGTALNMQQILGRDPESTDLLKTHFNSITPENVMKWEFIHPKPDSFTYEAVDRFIELGEKYDMFIVGHVLVWHQQTPEWVFESESGERADRKKLLRRMRKHITAVAGRYSGRIDAWDVVNEAFDAEGNLRETPWLEIIGKDYIRKAFEYAHEAAPDAELYYNDYDMWKPGKREAVVELVRELKADGVPIHGIGLQGHWGMDYPPLDELEASLKAYAALGVDIAVTELDVNILPFPDEDTGADISKDFALRKKLNPYHETLPDSMQRRLADRYRDFFVNFMKYRDSISRVTLWGIHDSQSWLNNWPVRGRTNYPLLFDRQYEPKEAFFEVIDAGQKEN